MLVKKMRISSSVSARMGARLFSGSILDLSIQAEPSPGFFQLFQTNLELVNEVFSGFGRFYFAVIAIWRSPTAEKLPSNMITRSRIRKRINQSNNPRTKFEKSLFEVEAQIPFPLDVGRWALSVGR